MTRRLTTVVLGWLGVVAVAVSALFAGLSALGLDRSPATGQALTPTQVQHDLAALPSASSVAPELKATPRASGTSAMTVIATAGGSVGVVCTGSTIRFGFVNPNQGYRYEVGVDGPDSVSADFVSVAARVILKGTCVNGKAFVAQSNVRLRG